MVTVRKNSIINAICQDTGLSAYQVRSVLDSFIATVALCVSKGHKVALGDFGSFSPQRRAARTGRNPHTGEAVPIPARVIAKFVPGNLMKQSTYGLKPVGGNKK